jgi:hypothetical protein
VEATVRTQQKGQMFMRTKQTKQTKMERCHYCVRVRQDCRFKSETNEKRYFEKKNIVVLGMCIADRR